jgi:hypothetical protein
MPDSLLWLKSKRAALQVRRCLYLADRIIAGRAQYHQLHLLPIVWRLNIVFISKC